jgi:AcrR family transcriptional regulator
MTAMTTDTVLEARPAPADDDTSKRRQIVDGARQMFLAEGFDAASMNDIARAAGVSKGTLYVYFKNKEELFVAMVQEECREQAEGAFQLDPNDHDIPAVLDRLGRAYIAFLCRPEKASALRTVIAIAQRMPEVGKIFYESGPAMGRARLSAYLKAQVGAGLIAIEDTDLAAVQFMEMCAAPLFKPILFSFAPAPGADEIEHVVKTAVRVFTTGYGAR